MQKTNNATQSCKPDLVPLQGAIKELNKYLSGAQPNGKSSSGLLNWLLIDPEGEWFDEDYLIDRKVFADKLDELKATSPESSEGDVGRGLDLMILAVGNDLVAQIEMAGNFRRLKPAHHFAKGQYNLYNLAKGAEGTKSSDSILEEYTYTFLKNAVAHSSQAYG